MRVTRRRSCGSACNSCAPRSPLGSASPKRWGTLDLKPEDLAVPFFVNYSKASPGTFPSTVEQKSPDGKITKKIEPTKVGSDIQGFFFDMWLQEHPTAQLHEVSADLVMASGSGLDPHITLKSGQYQLDHVAGVWAG